MHVMKTTKHSIRETRAAYLFLLPAYLIYLALLALPLFGSLAFSFLEIDRVTLDLTFVGLENFQWVLTDPRFWITLKNTFAFISMAVIGNVGGGLVLALLLNRKLPSPLLYVLRLAYFFPVLVSLAFVSYIWAFLFATDLGIINYYVTALGFGKIGWLTDKDVALLSVIIIDVWKNVGFFVIVFLAALQGIPKSLLEAAYLDGAPYLSTLARIKIPCIAPVILFCVTFATIGGLQVFDSIRILTNGGPGDATRSVVMYMFGEAFDAGQLGTGAASALVLLLVICAVVAVQFGVARRAIGGRA